MDTISAFEENIFIFWSTADGIIQLGDCYRRIVAIRMICAFRTSSLDIHILNATQRTWTSRKRPQIWDNVMACIESPQLLVRCLEKFQKIFKERWRRGHCSVMEWRGGGGPRKNVDRRPTNCAYGIVIKLFESMIGVKHCVCHYSISVYDRVVPHTPTVRLSKLVIWNSVVGCGKNRSPIVWIDRDQCLGEGHLIPWNHKYALFPI